MASLHATIKHIQSIGDLLGSAIVVCKNSPHGAQERFATLHALGASILELSHALMLAPPQWSAQFMDHLKLWSSLQQDAQGGIETEAKLDMLFKAIPLTGHIIDRWNADIWSAHRALLSTAIAPSE